MRGGWFEPADFNQLSLLTLHDFPRARAQGCAHVFFASEEKKEGKRASVSDARLLRLASPRSGESRAFKPITYDARAEEKRTTVFRRKEAFRFVRIARAAGFFFAPKKKKASEPASMTPVCCGWRARAAASPEH